MRYVTERIWATVFIDPKKKESRVVNESRVKTVAFVFDVCRIEKLDCWFGVSKPIWFDQIATKSKISRSGQWSHWLIERPT